MAARAFETQEKASKFCIRTKRMEMMLATKLAGGLNPRRHLKKLVIGQVAASTERFDTINPRAAVLERTRQRFRELAVARDQSMRAHGPAGLRKTVASGDLCRTKSKKIRKARSGYAIGYGRPPTSSQFQPGQSGNPKGRPKGARNASSLAREALERPINVKVKGTSRKMTVRKAAYFRLAERAVAGDVKALDYLLALENEERPSSSDQLESERTAAKDLAMLQDFFDRQRADRPQQKRHDHPQRRAGESKRGNK